MPELASGTEEVALGSWAGAKMALPGSREDIRAINQVRTSNRWVHSEDLLLSGLRFLTHNSLRWKRGKKREARRTIYIMSQFFWGGAVTANETARLKANL